VTRTNKLVLTAIKSFIDTIYTYSTFFKTDLNGNTILSKTFRNPDDIQPADIIETNDGGYMITGHNHTMDTIASVFNFILKTDSIGNVLWSKTSIDTNGTYGFKVVEVNDSIYFGTSSYINPITKGDIYYYSFNKNGNVKSERLLSGMGTEAGRSLLANNGSVFLLGNTIDSFDTINEFVISKINVNGGSVWSKRYHFNSDSVIQRGLFITKRNNNSFAVGGNLYSKINDISDFFICELDTNGNITNSKIYDIDQHDDITSLSPDSIQGYLVNCLSTPSSVSGKFTALSIDASLNVNKAKQVLNSSSIFNSQGPTILRKNNIVYLGGIQYNNSPVSAIPFILKMDTSFNSNCINPTVSASTYSYPIIVNSISNFNVEQSLNLLQTKSIYSQDISFNDSTYCSGILNIKDNHLNNEIKIYPNPINGIVTIELADNNQNCLFEIYNITGQIIKTENINSQIQKIDLYYLSNGIYVVKLTDKNKTVETRKITILK
jgi:hypothetical protein